jgi:hypothetical protein
MKLQFNFAPGDYVWADVPSGEETTGFSELVNAQEVNNEDQGPAR